MRALLSKSVLVVLAGIMTTGVVFAEGMTSGVVYAVDHKVAPELRDDVVAAIKLFEQEGPEEYELMELWLNAGASYMKELTAPASQADTYVDPEKQRMMIGAYLFDMNYAQVFKRYNDAKEYAEALDLLLGKLGYRNRDLQRSFQEIIEKVDAMDQKALYVKMDEVIDQVWKDYVDTPGGMDLAIDGIYGWMIEGLYLACEVAAQQDYDVVFLSYLSDQMNYFKSMDATLILFEEDSNLATVVEKSERLKFVEQVLNHLGTKSEMTEADVVALRKLIAHVRADLIK